MYRKETKGQLHITDFINPFKKTLDPENRWVKLAEMMPWDKIDDIYSKSMCDNNGRDAISSRMAFAACYIKQNEHLADANVPIAIAENPYMQFFAGNLEFNLEPPFDSSMMVHFRKRFPVEEINKVNEYLCTGRWPEETRNVDKNDDDDSSGSSDDDSTEIYSNEHPEENDGTLIMDATVAPADIRYPTDVSLLEQARKILEKAILLLWILLPTHTGHMLPYSSKVARKEFLNISKAKKCSVSKVRALQKKHVNRIEQALDVYENLSLKFPDAVAKFPSWLKKRLEVIPLLYEQQKFMVEQNTTSVPNRIVSLEQPHVRPIVRGKKPNPTEFGQKIHLSTVAGYTFLELTSWENFNESQDLKQTVLDYHRKFGCYPKAVLADKIYQTRENRRFCKRLGTRLSGLPLGRKNPEKEEENKRQLYQDSCERNAIEGRNGNLKRRYGLGRIMSKLDENAKTEMCFALIVMNSAQKLRDQLLRFFSKMVFLCLKVFSRNYFEKNYALQ